MAELQGLMYPRTPTGAGTILPSPPWHYSGEMLTIEFRTDPARVAELLPSGLEVAEDDPGAVAIIWADWQSLFAILIPVWAFLLLPLLSVLKGETQDFLARSAKIQWALMLGVFCISHAPALLLLDIPEYDQNFLLLFFLITVVQLSDVLQYVFGKLFGKHKVAPRVSPAKTWEGLIGGGLSAAGIGAALYWITPFAPWQAGLLALTIVFAGFAGGLVLSAVKRSLGAKDWGTMIEGHGGALDRMDSVSFAAPVFFHLVNYFFVP